MTYALHFSCFSDDFPFRSAVYLSNTATVILEIYKYVHLPMYLPRYINMSVYLRDGTCTRICHQAGLNHAHLLKHSE